LAKVSAMSGKGRNTAPVVVREYRHSRNECVRALELLLKKSVSNIAAEPAPEPDGRDGTKLKGDSADAQIISR
jgi:hypothetical protein